MDFLKYNIIFYKKLFIPLDMRYSRFSFIALVCWLHDYEANYEPVVIIFYLFEVYVIMYIPYKFYPYTLGAFEEFNKNKNSHPTIDRSIQIPQKIFTETSCMTLY